MKKKIEKRKEEHPQ